MIGRALGFAWLRVRREPGRTALAVLGVTAIGALLFDMLLLSNGLLVSFRDRLDRSGFDVRIMGSDSAVMTGPPIEEASAIAARLKQLPSVAAVQRLSIASADVEGTDTAERVAVAGVDLDAPLPWTLLRRDIISLVRR
jgi:ABC-type lipoprotein release transport system permease subunit